MTRYFDHTTGETLYAKPVPSDEAAWGTDVVAGTELLFGGSGIGEYAFEVESTIRYAIYSQAGASPASSDTKVGHFDLGPNQALVDAIVTELRASQTLFSLAANFANNSELVLRQGDDYLAAQGTAWEKDIEIAGYDFTAVTSVRFGAGNTAGEPVLTGSASITGAAVGSATLRLEFTRAQTKLITPGEYRWDAEVIGPSSTVLTIDGGVLNVEASWSTLDDS